MLDIDTSDKKEQRNFGLVMAGAFVVLGGVRWLLHWRGSEEIPAPPYVLIGVAAVFGALGLVAPRALKPVFDAWLKLATVMNFIVTHLVLSIAFFLTVTPIGILMRLFGNPPLDQELDSSRDSYWEDVNADDDNVERYTKQF